MYMYVCMYVYIYTNIYIYICSRFGELANKIGLDEFADIIDSPPPGTDEVSVTCLF